jgi:fructokinase
MTKKILVMGEVLWDKFPNHVVLGGAPFNFAYRLMTLGEQVLLATRLGDDELGKKARLRATELGMNEVLFQIDNNRATGTVMVSSDSNNNPDFDIVPDVAYDYINWTKDLQNSSKSMDCIGFGTLIQRSIQSRETLHKLIEHVPAALRFLDLNLRKKCYSEENIIFSIENANILKLNEDEADFLANMLGAPDKELDHFCAFMLKEWKLQYIVVTLGKFGVYARSAEQEAYVPGYNLSTVDTVGAGDAFSAGFLHRLLADDSIKKACEFGNALGALTTTTTGGTAIVRQEKIKNILHGHIERCTHPDFAVG